MALLPGVRFRLHFVRIISSHTHWRWLTSTEKVAQGYIIFWIVVHFVFLFSLSFTVRVSFKFVIVTKPDMRLSMSREWLVINFRLWGAQFTNTIHLVTRWPFKLSLWTWKCVFGCDKWAIVNVQRSTKDCNQPIINFFYFHCSPTTYSFVIQVIQRVHYYNIFLHCRYFYVTNQF